MRLGEYLAPIGMLKKTLSAIELQEIRKHRTTRVDRCRRLSPGSDEGSDFVTRYEKGQHLGEQFTRIPYSPQEVGALSILQRQRSCVSATSVKEMHVMVSGKFSLSLCCMHAPV